MSTRSRRQLGVGVAVSGLVAISLARGALGIPPRRVPSAPAPSRLQAAADTRHYAITARVRPVLFWVGKDSVGEARMTWLTGPNGERGYEFLIGSDPARAPRQINQWGYVREMEEQGTVQVFGLMTDSGEKDRESLNEAQAANGKTSPQVYKVIHATIADGKATADVQRLTLPEPMTFRDLDAVVARVPRGAPGESIPLPAGTQAGFLSAMTSLIHESVEVCGRTGVPPVGGLRRSYVWGKKLYIVTTRASKLLDRTTIKGREYRRVINSEFEARVATQPEGEIFRVVYGTDGALREVPIKLVYRPNFWFEAEVVLVDAPSGHLP
jgi:hypothetical protein